MTWSSFETFLLSSFSTLGILEQLLRKGCDPHFRKIFSYNFYPRDHFSIQKFLQHHNFFQLLENSWVFQNLYSSYFYKMTYLGWSHLCLLLFSGQLCLMVYCNKRFFKWLVFWTRKKGPFAYFDDSQLIRPWNFYRRVYFTQKRCLAKRIGFFKAKFKKIWCYSDRTDRFKKFLKQL